MKSFKPDNKCLSPNDILQAWNKEMPAALVLSGQQRTSRRQFLRQSIFVAGSLSLAPIVLAEKNTKQLNLKASANWPQPWLTLSYVQNQLFPRSGKINTDTYSPGASDINATAYLKLMLNVPGADKTERNFIIKGVSWLDGIANSMFGKPFIKLNNDKREKVLQKISKSRSGESWLSTLLSYIFEALLTDPVYGGNTRQAGWKWLQHQAGFPRPPENKKYWLLRDNASGSNKKLRGASS